MVCKDDLRFEACRFSEKRFVSVGKAADGRVGKGEKGAMISRDGSFTERISEDEVIVFSSDETWKVVFVTKFLILGLCESANEGEPGGTGDARFWIFFFEEGAEGIGSELLVEDEDIFRSVREMRLKSGEMMPGKRCKDAVWGAKVFLEPAGSGEAAGSQDEIEFVFAGIDIVPEVVTEAVEAGLRKALRLKFSTQECCVGSNVECRGTEDAGTAVVRPNTVWNIGKVGEEGMVGFFDASIVGLGAVSVDGDCRDMKLLFGKAGKSMEVGADDGGDGGADEGEKGKRMVRSSKRVDGVTKFFEEMDVTTEDSIHVAEGGTCKDARERRFMILGQAGRFLIETWFVEAAEVASASAGIENRDEAAERLEDRCGTSVIGREGRKVEAEAFHNLGDSFHSMIWAISFRREITA